MLQQQCHLLFKRLDVLSAQLKTEIDSLRADEILQEMRNIGNLLQELVNVPRDVLIDSTIETFNEFGLSKNKDK